MTLPRLSRWILAAAAAALTACATNDSPPCRRVSATEFMRPHTFKGIASDEFVGVTSSPRGFPPRENEGKAFKTIWEMGMFRSWAVIWCPVNELPKDYLATARKNPNRPVSSDPFTHE